LKIAEARKLFPVFKNRTYLFSGGIAPANTRAAEAMQDHLDALTYNPSDYYHHSVHTATEVKHLFARLMHCDHDEIAITENTSSAINIATDLLRAKPGDNVVVDDFTYPSSIYPWLLPSHHGIEVRPVKQRDGFIHMQDIEKAIDDRTVALSVCHVSPFEGFRHDIAKLAEIAHACDAVLIIDGAQGAGAENLNLHESGVDFYGCCAMKWLLGAPGIGFLYVARKHLDKIPSRAGYVSGGFDVNNFKLVSNASRFELGKPSLMSLAYTKPGLEILLDLGMENVHKHILNLSGNIISGLKAHNIKVVTPEDPNHRMGIVAVHEHDADKLFETLHAYKIDLYAKSKTLPYYKGGFIQIAPHIYNNLEDVNRLIEALDAYHAQK